MARLFLCNHFRLYPSFFRYEELKKRTLLCFSVTLYYH